MDSEKLKELAAVGNELSAELEEPRKTLFDTEAALIAMRLGLTASIQLNRVYELSFRKLNGEWGLYIIGNAPALVSPACRAYQAEAPQVIAAEQRLNDLLDRLISAAGSHLRAVRNALALVNGGERDANTQG